MKRTIHVKPAAPQYSVITNITFAQTDAWFGHTTQDLRMDLIYPEDTAHDYPCIVWICGGAWLSIDKSAHLAYLSELARAGFVVASVQYRKVSHRRSTYWGDGRISGGIFNLYGGIMR